MEELLLKFASTQGFTTGILLLGIITVAKYLDKKETLYRDEIKAERNLNQSNTERFIMIAEKNIEVVTNINSQIAPLHPKLNEMHDDIKIIKGKH